MLMDKDEHHHVVLVFDPPVSTRAPPLESTYPPQMCLVRLGTLVIRVPACVDPFLLVSGGVVPLLGGVALSFLRLRRCLMTGSFGVTRGVSGVFGVACGVFCGIYSVGLVVEPPYSQCSVFCKGVIHPPALWRWGVFLCSVGLGVYALRHAKANE